MKSIKINFWGVRGSIPTPGSSTVKYGGNTACVSIEFSNGAFFIMDAGSGIRELGKELLKRKGRLDLKIFISHFHWDHIQGLPFFRPAFQDKNRITIFGSDEATLDLDQIISFQMNPTYFPIAIEDMTAAIRFKPIQETRFRVNDVEIQTQYLNHPGYALGYRVTYKGKSVVYISDNEPFHFGQNNTAISQTPNEHSNLEDLFDNFTENKDEHLINFCKNADILIHDTQFLPEEYESKISWGHSPYNYTVDLAIKANINHLILFHHDPDHDDAMVDKIENLSRDYLKKHNENFECQAAREKMIIEI